MTASLLSTRLVEKPWGRHRLWPGFADPAADGPPIGEAWFQTPDAGTPKLLIKYLFTSERLSVQVHPDDEQARARGYKRGKDECWVILDAEPDARIALGTLMPMSAGELRAAAEDGSIVDKLDWKPVRAGEFYYSGAGTIHAIGAGITLVETQQNVDLTYRLYDYGSDRELHLDDGVAVSNPVPYVAPPMPGRVSDDRAILCEGPKFVLERWTGGTHHVSLPDGTPGWLVPLTGEGAVGGVAFKAGECVLVEGDETVVAAGGSDVLFAYPGTTRIV